MKKIFSFALMACALLLNTACSDENVESRTPVASIQYDTNKTTLKVNESLVIDFTGVADLVAIYPGDNGHRYEKRDEMETGIAVNKNHFTYSYKAPGTYHVVCVASTFDTYMGGNLKQATCSFDVTVVDDETEFKDLYTTITPNTFYANKLGDDAWVLNLPTKQVYNGKDIKVNPKNQRIYYDMPSDSTLVFIDMADADYQLLQNYSALSSAEQKALKNKVTSNKVRYNLSQDHVITVRSYAGTIKQYTLYCLIYPEFKTVTVNGVKGVLTRDAFNQDHQTYTFTLPSGTDVANAKIEYTLDGTGTFLVEGNEVASGTTTNLGGKTLTLERSAATNAQAKAVSNIEFVFKFQ